MNVSEYMCQVGSSARAASRAIAAASSADKGDALKRIAAALDTAREQLKAANAIDMEAAGQKGIDQPLIDRLLLDDKAIDRMIEGVLQIEGLNDPVGEITDLKYQPSGLQIGKMRVPLGVIGIIYESRPNVTVDAAALCIKSGNACILRGGSEAIESNRAIATVIEGALADSALPTQTVQLVTTTDRAAVGELLRLDKFVDVIVPRGGKGLIERIIAESRIPIIKHLDGVCHVYIDAAAEAEMAVAIAVNSKTEKYAVCNALETLLVHEAKASEVLPTLGDRYAQAGVELRACERAQAYLSDTVPATEDDWYAEYLGPILAVKVVDDLDSAIAHINQYGSQHTDTIVTQNFGDARRFLTEVDSASVMVNASTQFADGFEYGLGAEVGISTDKIHARGPVGIEGLTSQKFVVLGSGEIPSALIALFGGTFDPIHNGHIAVAHAAARCLNLEDVHLVVAASPYHKQTEATPAHHRLGMVQAVAATDARLVPDGSDLKSSGASYTVELLSARPQEEVRTWVIGADAFADVLSWYRWPEVFDLTNFLVFERVGFASNYEKRLLSVVEPRQVDEIDPTRHGQVRFASVPLPEVSSTQIRQALTRGTNVDHLVPAEALTYIQTHHLYRQHKPQDA